jgi:hypothetical protein
MHSVSTGRTGLPLPELEDETPPRRGSRLQNTTLLDRFRVGCLARRVSLTSVFIASILGYCILSRVPRVMQDVHRNPPPCPSAETQALPNRGRQRRTIEKSIVKQVRYHLTSRPGSLALACR